MKKYLSKLIGMSLVVSLILTMGGIALAKEITPSEFMDLATPDKLAAKKIVVKVPVEVMIGLEGLPLLDFEKEKATIPGLEWAHTSNMDVMRAMYSRALFEIKHPEVKIEFVGMPGYGTEVVKQALLTQIAEGTAPSLWGYIRYPADFGKEGYAMDVTDLYKEMPLSPEERRTVDVSFASQTHMIYKGRLYGLPTNDLSIWCKGFLFRKDWFREAGIFNKRGEPGVDYPWSLEDFRKISRKITAPKKKQWGYAAFASPRGSDLGPQYFTWVIDPSSKDHIWMIPPDDPIMISVYGTYNKMVFKDQSIMVSSSWDDSHAQFWGGRAAMVLAGGVYNLPNLIIHNPHKLSPTKELKDLVGYLPKHTAIYDMYRATPKGSVGSYTFNGTLNKEEMRAAYEWYLWEEFGEGKKLKIEQMVKLYPIIGKKALDFNLIGLTSLRPTEFPKGFPPLEDFIPEDVLRAMRFWIESVPEEKEPKNFAPEFGIPSFGYMNSEQDRIFRSLLLGEPFTDPNYNAEKSVAKVANMWNKLREKQEIPENYAEKVKAYYSANDKWLANVYPVFHASPEYKYIYNKYMAPWIG